MVAGDGSAVKKLICRPALYTASISFRTSDAQRRLRPSRSLARIRSAMALVVRGAARADELAGRIGIGRLCELTDKERDEHRELLPGESALERAQIASQPAANDRRGLERLPNNFTVPGCCVP